MKEKYITRTFSRSGIKYTVYDGDSGKLRTDVVNVGFNANMYGKAELVKFLNKHCAISGLVVDCEVIEVTEELRGMSEEAFIEHSNVLPPRTQTKIV